MAAYQPIVPPHVAEIIRSLPPDIKRSVKAAIRGLSENPSLGEPLLRELDGHWKYRVKRFRIVYTVHRRNKVIRIVAVGHRRRVYEALSMELAQHRVSEKVKRHTKIK